ncbi:acyl-CoA thioesterase [Bradyrhizobium sp. LHD-71]|uniref:acyl-CoA thioesterase n=1 Tax=Bradyrhizobium sp. LHD-71 TaxID=3072141 RepID=UPI00280D6D11|nr:acyl-CoA thioesterase [Bradyrhizobium sp. LHD-71]MDQ8727923.1 acyl-CoA thioesterase [Bradyrhizobium sp. LHD-71]
MSGEAHRHDSSEPTAAPRGELSLRTLAMPADTNQSGDIFGGWLLSQMDIGGGIFAGKTVRLRTVTVAIEAMTFRKPVFVGDVVSVYTDTVRVGRTSITVRVEAWVTRSSESQMILVTDGTFTYVAIDERGAPTPIIPDGLTA